MTATPRSPTQHRDAEFRQITVMFSDLVGSTQLSEQLDPEDLQKLIDAYRAECDTAIRRYGGEVARYFGDGVMAFFGWPYAHEDDASRAVHAALEIVIGVAKISGPVSLTSRVGVCSGPVVVGEIGGSGTWSMDAIGETPNIAARLQTLAAANTVIVSESTRRLVPAAFDFQDLGLKGTQRRHRASARVSRRFGKKYHQPIRRRTCRLSHSAHWTLERTQPARRQNGRKSRKATARSSSFREFPESGNQGCCHELKSYIRQEPHVLLHHQGSPYYNQSAFFPMIEQIEQAAQLTAREADADKLAKLKAYLPRAADSSIEPVLLIAKLLSIPLDGHLELSGLTPQQIKNRTISTLVDMLLAFSVQGPTLCIFEDAHWLDPSTLELLELIISRIDHAHVLLIVSCRPEFHPAWIAHTNATIHSLTRLSNTEVKTMIRDLLQGGSLPQPLLDQIIEKADGVPLFIEELTNSMLSAPLRTRGASERMVRSSLLRVPDTLSDALMERLDRVAPSRRLAQIAAVIGREFSADLLSAASQVDEDDMLSALALLEKADIIYRADISPTVRFAFKHVLLRDAIYDSLLRSKRHQIHADIAAILEHDFPELAENQPEVLAYHYQEAGNHTRGHSLLVRVRTTRARAFRQRGSDRQFSQSPSASKHACRNARADQPGDPHPIGVGNSVDRRPGLSLRGNREAFSRAHTLCLQLGDIPEYSQALFGLWGHSWMGGRNDEALQMAGEFLSRAQALSDPHTAHGGASRDGQHAADHRRLPIVGESFRGIHQAFDQQRKAAALQPLHGGAPGGVAAADVLGFVVSRLSGSSPFARLRSARPRRRSWPPLIQWPSPNT